MAARLTLLIHSQESEHMIREKVLLSSRLSKFNNSVTKILDMGSSKESVYSFNVNPITFD